MFPPRTALRTIVASMLACGLLATTTSSAVARPIDDRGDVPTSSLAGSTSETPRQDLRSPDTRDAARPVTQDLRSPDARDAANAEQIARATEDYYQSFDEPVPVAPFTSLAPTSPSDDTPWLLISAIAAALAGALASTAVVLRRRRLVV